jgi:hypothetical protein
MRFNLQVDQPNFVAGFANDGCDRLQPERFETQEHARVHQATGVNSEHLHAISLQRRRVHLMTERAGLSTYAFL